MLPAAIIYSTDYALCVRFIAARVAAHAALILRLGAVTICRKGGRVPSYFAIIS
jgi:hypothetical protein